MTEAANWDDRIANVKKQGDWNEAVRLCREAVAATETAPFACWFRMRMKLVGCLMKIENDWAIDEAISVLHSLLSRAVAENVLDKVALANAFLGSFYTDRHKGDRRENLRAAIAYYDTSLKSLDPRGDVLFWGSVVVQLGTAYVNLARLSGSLPDYARSLRLSLRTAMRAFDRHKCTDEYSEALWVSRKLNEWKSRGEEKLPWGKGRIGRRRAP